MPRLTFEEKRQKIKDIETRIANLEEELRKLLEPQKTEVNQLPDDFSVYESVLGVVREKSDGISKGEIIKQIKYKKNVSLSSQQVQSAVSYLKSKGLIEIIGRALYRMRKDQEV